LKWHLLVRPQSIEKGYRRAEGLEVQEMQRIPKSPEKLPHRWPVHMGLTRDAGLPLDRLVPSQLEIIGDVAQL